jgi:hypothetical protein
MAKETGQSACLQRCQDVHGTPEKCLRIKDLQVRHSWSCLREIHITIIKIKIPTATMTSPAGSSPEGGMYIVYTPFAITNRATKKEMIFKIASILRLVFLKNN